MNWPAPLSDATLTRRQSPLAEPYEEPERLRRPQPMGNEPRVTDRIPLPEPSREVADPEPYPFVSDRKSVV